MEGGEDMNGGRTSRKEKEKVGTCDEGVKIYCKQND
jgi:hypothetical protein